MTLVELKKRESIKISKYLKLYKGDLHIHSCLSPCADLYMTPKRIIDKCIEKGIDIIAICDHNSCENVRYVIEAAKKHSITVIAGMEITTSEEVHIVALFPNNIQAWKMQQVIYSKLEGVNDEDLFGVQAVVNESDEVVSINEKLLIGVPNLTINEVVEHIHKFKGIAICAHIDREGFGIIGKLGFIPDDLPIDAIELSPLTKDIKPLLDNNPDLAKFPIFFSSDAHTLDAIGNAYTALLLQEPSFREIKLAIRERAHRQIRSHGGD